MKKKISTQELEQRLRNGALHRRATLDGLASAYPVGDYPPRSAERRAQATGPGVLARVAWLIGLGGATTAGLLGLVTLVSVIIMPDPMQPSAPILAAQPQPETLATSVRSLIASLGQIEAQMGERLDPSVEAATGWPDQLSALPIAINEAGAGLQNPIEQEFIAFRADLQTAADYIRQQWRVEKMPSPTSDFLDSDAATIAG